MLTTHALRAALVALAALALGASSAVALDVEAEVSSDGARARIDLTGLSDDTSTVQATTPAASTGIGPGSPLTIEIEDEGTFGCTASWVFTDGADLLLGAAGHCFLPLEVATTHGPGAKTGDKAFDLSDTRVSVCVADCEFGGISTFFNGQYEALGPLVYARQESAGGDEIGWDFGVVQIPEHLEGLVRTTMPVFGGSSAHAALESGDQVCHYGNGVAVGEVFLTKARTGLGLLDDSDAWFAATPAAPGDSGSALQTCETTDGDITGIGAVGTLTHLTTLGVAGTTNARSMQLAAQDAGLQLELVLGEVAATASDGSTDGGSTDDADSGGGGKSGDAPRRGPKG